MSALLESAATVQTGAGVRVYQPMRTFQASVSGTGAVSATVNIEVSNDNANFLFLDTIWLSGTGSDSDGFVSDAPWAYVRADLTAISGTGAEVDVIMGGA